MFKILRTFSKSCQNSCDLRQKHFKFLFPRGPHHFLCITSPTERLTGPFKVIHIHVKCKSQHCRPGVLDSNSHILSNSPHGLLVQPTKIQHPQKTCAVWKGWWVAPGPLQTQACLVELCLHFVERTATGVDLWYTTSISEKCFSVGK